MFFNYIIIHFNKFCIIGEIGSENLYKFVQHNHDFVFKLLIDLYIAYTHTEKHPIEPIILKAKYLLSIILYEAIYTATV